MEISFGEFIAAFGVSVSLLGIFSTIIFNMWRRIIRNADEFAAYKLHVAENYASQKHLVSMETKIIASEERTLNAINNLSERLDRLITRWDERT